MIKRFVKYRMGGLISFDNGADYVYFNSKHFYTAMKDGTRRRCNYTNKQCIQAINNGWWKEDGPATRNTSRYYKGPINPEKQYLFIEPSYIWFAKGEMVIKHKWYKGYTLKTKEELDNECYVGSGKFLVELP
jgi:hypothetical protein